MKQILYWFDICISTKQFSIKDGTNTVFVQYIFRYSVWTHFVQILNKYCVCLIFALITAKEIVIKYETTAVFVSYFWVSLYVPTFHTNIIQIPYLFDICMSVEQFQTNHETIYHACMHT